MISSDDSTRREVVPSACAHRRRSPPADSGSSGRSPVGVVGSTDHGHHDAWDVAARMPSSRAECRSSLKADDDYSDRYPTLCGGPDSAWPRAPRWGPVAGRQLQKVSTKVAYSHKSSNLNRKFLFVVQVINNLTRASTVLNLEARD